VRYVLEGSVRKEEGRVRITCQLIDAQTGGHVWSERYDRDLKELFALQDEITRNVMTALRVKLTEGEQVRYWAEKAQQVKQEAYEKTLQAKWYHYKGTEEGNVKAQKLLEEVIALEPQWAAPYALLAAVHWVAALSGWSKDPRKSVRKAYEMANKALSLDESSDSAHSALGMISVSLGRYDEAVKEGERAVELNPNGAEGLAILGQILNNAGRPEQAIPILHKSMLLNPMPPFWYYAYLGQSYRLTEQYDKAIAKFEKGLRVAPDNSLCLLGLAATYSLTGRETEARKTMTEFLRVNPKYSLEHAEKTIRYKDPAVKKRLIDALKKAGLK
jgi:adenylate cyclase